MRRHFLFVSLATVLFLAAPLHLLANEAGSSDVSVGEWTMDYAAALSLAEKQELPVFLNFTGSDWCVWCKHMQKAVFDTPEWKDYAEENLVLVTLDFPRNPARVPAEYKRRNQLLQQQFGVQGYPTFIVLDHDGETVLGQLGASREITPDQFIEQLQDLLRFRPAAIARATEGMSAEKAAAYERTLTALQTVRGELRDWLSTQPQRTPANEARFNDYLKRLESLEAQLNGFKL